jgi:DNA-binding LytR/AlgR family response regulator
LKKNKKQMLHKSLTAIIIDDEPEAITNLEKLAQGVAGLTIAGSTTKPEKALSLFLKARPDLLFLDIQMPGMNGFDVLKELHDNKLNPYIIFTTAFDNHAIQAIKAGAFDYLLKPIDPDELIVAIEKVHNDIELHSLEQRINSLERVVHNHRKLRFNTRSGYLLIHPDEIFYIQADWNYSEIYLSKEKHEVISMTLGAVEELLPKETFVRINRSIIINRNFITKIQTSKRLCHLNKDGEECSFTITESHLKQLS